MNLYQFSIYTRIYNYNINVIVEFKNIRYYHYNNIRVSIMKYDIFYHKTV